MYKGKLSWYSNTEIRYIDVAPSLDWVSLGFLPNIQYADAEYVIEEQDDITGVMDRYYRFPFGGLEHLRRVVIDADSGVTEYLERNGITWLSTLLPSLEEAIIWLPYPAGTYLVHSTGTFSPGLGLEVRHWDKDRQDAYWHQWDSKFASLFSSQTLAEGSWESGRLRLILDDKSVIFTVVRRERLLQFMNYLAEEHP
jgi:hypothetical protein